MHTPPPDAAPQAPDPVSSAPRRRFELLRELGSGTFGTVYLADMQSLGGFKKRVALKVLNSQWDDGSDAGRRLRDEARLLGRLRHRCIVSVDDLIRIDGRWGVVMEYIAGADLEHLVNSARDQQQPISQAAALEICAAIAEALHAAYAGDGHDAEALEVVHRDIKPSNVLLTAGGDVKVLDFGIALASFDEREAQTGRVRYGSIPYMAPERILGEPETPRRRRLRPGVRPLRAADAGALRPRRARPRQAQPPARGRPVPHRRARCPQGPHQRQPRLQPGRAPLVRRIRRPRRGAVPPGQRQRAPRGGPGAHPAHPGAAHPPAARGGPDPL